MAWQTSSILPMRPIGLVSFSFCITESFSISVRPAYLNRFVFSKELETQLHLTPNLANSMAADFVSISSPALLMQYEIRPGCGREPLIHDTLTMHPCAAISMSWKKFVRTYGARILTSIR